MAVGAAAGLKAVWVLTPVFCPKVTGFVCNSPQLKAECERTVLTSDESLTNQLAKVPWN